MLFFKKLLLCLTLVVIIINSSESLQCYVCTNQDRMDDKCMRTVMKCDENEDQDTCLSTIRWGSPPYWTENKNTKQFYINKKCSTKAYCETLKSKTMPLCTQSVDKDWICTDCCFKDDCNYQLTMGSSAVKCNLLILIGCVMILFGFHVTL